MEVARFRFETMEQRSRSLVWRQFDSDEFFIDENGVIVAKNLRGFELHRKIDEHVESF